MNASVAGKAVLYLRSRFSWEPSEIGAAKPDGARLLREAQPPSGGCVLKRNNQQHPHQQLQQPPSGGCVLKQKKSGTGKTVIDQPPSGGCVLKLTKARRMYKWWASRLQAAVC